jgi:hypothetical protein
MVTGSSWWEASARLLTDWDSAPEDPFPSFRTSRGSHPAVGGWVPTGITKSSWGRPAAEAAIQDILESRPMRVRVREKRHTKRRRGERNVEFCRGTLYH